MSTEVQEEEEAVNKIGASYVLTDSINHYLMSMYTVLGISSVCLQVYSQGPLHPVGCAKET